MASLELRKHTYRVVFLYRGAKYGYSLQTGDRQEAEALAGGVEKTLMRIEQRLLKVPAGVDIVAFVKADGQVEAAPGPAPHRASLKELGERYEQAHSLGALEENSLATARMHLRHVRATLGDRFPVETLTLADLQRHVERRAKKTYRGRPLSPVTLRKEVASFRACWNWGVQAGLVRGPFPSRGLKYPKGAEKPPFQTWEEIDRKVARGGLSAAERRELWDCLFLTLPEVAELLEFVRAQARHGFLYPMFCFAAHTGARRSEMLRLKVTDVDFPSRSVILHERKRSKERRTHRRVPLSDFLSAVLRQWLDNHPGGQYLFCHELRVARSKKKRAECVPLTRDEANDHFKRTVRGSKWAVLRGWHVFRHSFVSNCAAAGVDQRVVDEWSGHQTEEMRKRYRHLFPGQQRQAIQLVFGQGP